MNRRLDDDLQESLKNLDQKIRMKAEYQDQLRKRVLGEIQRPVTKTSSNRKIWISAAVVLLLFLGSSPFYSTTMASLVAKIIPLEIKVNDATIHESIMAVIEREGYEASFVGTIPNPYTIEISLMEAEDNLSTMKEVLEPKIENLLYEKGIDSYKLKITQFEGSVETPEKYIESNERMESVGTIIRDAFSHFGYTELAQAVTFGISEEFLSKTLELDMPDHIEEAEDILSFVKDGIKTEDLDIKHVELRYYNEKHRQQDNRWSYIASDIHESMAGKSTYNITGISYKVKGGVANVSIKTVLPENTEEQIISEIETALRKFLSSEEVREMIQNDQYSIVLLSKSKTELLQISNVAE
ncbi:hypothetical protein [Paenisporosarcina indica]|uniref:hypothetical protein n=1 Tax=Paenisporosarcina indica TaxID=650093 RepID=UPI00094FFA17|nr:hypothetical protein [Paenisporosarcina indica]